MAFNMIKSLAKCCHLVASTYGPMARIYLSCLRMLVNFVSDHRRAQVLNSIRSITWPAAALRPQRIILGADISVWLEPHQGEVDFAAVLGGKLQYEPEVFHCLDGRMSKYAAVVEIGANVGIFTLYFAKKLALNGSGRVFAFEPSQKARQRLYRNLDINDMGNVSCFSCAVSDRMGFGYFFEPQDHLTNGSLVSSFAQKFSPSIQMMPCLLIDGAMISELLEGEEGRILIKIDVEGHEAAVVKSLAPVIERFQPDILIEVLPEFASEIFDACKASAPGYGFHALTLGGLKEVDRPIALEGRDCLLVPSKLM